MTTRLIPLLLALGAPALVMADDAPPVAIAQFDSAKFIVTLTPRCAQGNNDCGRLHYKGVRKADGATVNLDGEVIYTACGDADCPVQGYRFVNHNAEYLLDRGHSTLTVKVKGKIVTHTRGSWLQPAFTGQWQGEQGRREDQTQDSLGLALRQQGDKVSGTYCFMVRNGARIDCADPDDPQANVHGTVKGNVAVIHFDSGFGGKDGVAELTLEGNRLHWKLLKELTGGELYAPDNFTPLEKTSDYYRDVVFHRDFISAGYQVSVSNYCDKFLSACDRVRALVMRKKGYQSVVIEGRALKRENGELQFVFADPVTQDRADISDDALQVVLGGESASEPGHWQTW